jgi:CspA family cold shock protein
MQRSTVKWFDAKKGYGFIQHPEEGDDVFVHYSQILSEKDFKTLRTGQQVRFEMNDGPKGLHALDVRPLDEPGEKEPTKKADEDGAVSAEEESEEESAPEEEVAAEEESAAEENVAAAEEPAVAESTAESTAASADPAQEPAPEQEQEEEEEDDWRSDWEEEDWTDEHGNPPDPMAGPTF